MMKVKPPAVEGLFDRIGKDLHPQFIPKVGCNPEIMIAREVRYLHAGFRKVRERREEAEVPFGHDCPVLKPVVEEIAEDE